MIYIIYIQVRVCVHTLLTSGHAVGRWAGTSVEPGGSSRRTMGPGEGGREEEAVFAVVVV